MAEYRYLFCDALTGVLLEELPLDCQSFGQVISGAGTLTSTLPLSGITPNWRGATETKRTVTIALRGGQIAWGGWITKRRPTDGGTKAEITAETLEGWLAEQEIQSDLTFTNTDVFDIVRGILAHVAGQAGGNMRIDAGTNLAGYTQTVTYLGKDSTKVGDAIAKLAEVAPGFEYTIRWQRTGQVFTPYMTLASPGLSSGLDAIVLEYPGNLTDYDYPEDGKAARNVLTGVGADNAGTPLLARVEDSTGELAAGVPRLPGQLQLKDETDQTRLTARTTTALQAGLVDYVVPTAELRGDADPQFGDFPLGIAARLRATSLYHPAGVNGTPGLQVTRRVIGWSVNPAGQERVNVAFGATTGKITLPAGWKSISDYLRDVDRRLRELATRT